LLNAGSIYGSTALFLALAGAHTLIGFIILLIKKALHTAGASMRALVDSYKYKILSHIGLGPLQLPCLCSLLLETIATLYTLHKPHTTTRQAFLALYTKACLDTEAEEKEGKNITRARTL
jgi:hypothetical protein